MSGGKFRLPNQTGKDIDQPLAQDHHGSTRVTWNMWMSYQASWEKIGNDEIKL